MAFPAGRVGTREFYRITGVSKTTFFTKYRRHPHWAERLDIRIDSAGRLHMDEEAVRELAVERLEGDGRRRSTRADRILRTCVRCGQIVSRSFQFCPGCGKELAGD